MSTKPTRMISRGQRMTPEQQSDAEDALEPFYRVVGDICTQWSLVEHVVDDTIWTVARVPHHVGACMTSQIQSLEYRIRALLALLELFEVDKAIIKEFRKFANDGISLAQDRNRAVHDPLMFNLDKGMVMASRLSANRRLKYEMEAVAVDDFKAVVVSISRFRKRFIQLRDQLLADLNQRPEWLLSDEPASEASHYLHEDST